jgi:hypothetical protein
LNKLHIPSSNLWFLNVVLHIAVVRVAPLLVAIERCGASVRTISLVCIPDPLLLLNSPFVSDFSASQRKPDRNR